MGQGLTAGVASGQRLRARRIGAARDVGRRATRGRIGRRSARGRIGRLGPAGRPRRGVGLFGKGLAVRPVIVVVRRQGDIHAGRQPAMRWQVVEVGEFTQADAEALGDTGEVVPALRHISLGHRHANMLARMDSIRRLQAVGADQLLPRGLEVTGDGVEVIALADLVVAVHAARGHHLAVGGEARLGVAHGPRRHIGLRRMGGRLISGRRRRRSRGGRCGRGRSGRRR